MKRRPLRFKPHPSCLVKHSGTVQVRKKPRVMLASNEYHSGQAVYHYELGEWLCREAPDCLGFLLKQTASAAKLELLRRGFSWEWK